MAPPYICDLVTPYTPFHSLCCSADSLTLQQSLCSLKSVGERPFSFVALKLWNSLTFTVRNTPRLNSFKKMLKTRLFKIAFGSSFFQYSVESIIVYFIFIVLLYSIMSVFYLYFRLLQCL